MLPNDLGEECYPIKWAAAAAGAAARLLALFHSICLLPGLGTDDEWRLAPDGGRLIVGDGKEEARVTKKLKEVEEV